MSDFDHSKGEHKKLKSFRDTRNIHHHQTLGPHLKGTSSIRGYRAWWWCIFLVSPFFVRNQFLAFSLNRVHINLPGLKQASAGHWKLGISRGDSGGDLRKYWSHVFGLLGFILGL